MGMFRNSEESGGPVSEINITPLVDVMLVLLVIFMVTAPMMETGIPIQLPKANAKALPKEESPITLHLTKEGAIFLGKEEIPYAELGPKIQTLYKKRPKKEIFIRADGALQYAFVAQTMATVKNAGVHKIGLVTLPVDTKEKKP